jgi:hypothetical protein
VKILWPGFLSVFFTAQCFTAHCFAASLETKGRKIPQKYSRHFMSTRDLGPLTTTSNIKLKNTGTSAKTVYGIYVRQLSQVATGQPCASATVIYPGSTNTSVGSLAMAVNIGANEEADIGPGVLYNMIYGASYYVQVMNPSSPPGCSLPGCTWGSDTTIYDWCIQIGVLAPVTIGSGFTTANIVPATETVSTVNYDFNLVSSYQELGPVTCSDQTLTCSVTSTQTQSF